MKGESGTKVTLEIVRDGETEPLSFEVTRAEIEVPSIEYEMLEDSIGYIAVSAFEENTDEQFKTAIDKLEKEGMKGLIVDLRDNGGGLVDTVVNMLDCFLPTGDMIVYTKDKNGSGQEYKAKNEDQLDIPLAVLINGNSASASEIFAGAVQDYGIGSLVGTTSFGKGIVQNVIPMSDGTALKLTIAKYYTPNGRNIHKIGIEPDVEVELSDEAKKLVTIPLEKDNQLQKAIGVVKSKMGNQNMLENCLLQDVASQFMGDLFQIYEMQQAALLKFGANNIESVKGRLWQWIFKSGFGII